MGDNIREVRLNARIHNQREMIKHGQFRLEQVEGRANRLLDLLGVDPAQPLVMRLDEAIAMLHAKAA